MPSVSIRSLAGCTTNTSWRPPIRNEIFADHSYQISGAQRAALLAENFECGVQISGLHGG